MSKRTIAGALAVILVVLLCLFVTGGITDAESGSERELVLRAVKKAAVTCYALEGSYPQELEYLTEHYGLSYDKERYIVVYDAFAVNLMPDIQVLNREAGK